MTRRSTTAVPWAVGIGLTLATSWLAFEEGKPPPLPPAGSEAPLKHLWPVADISPRPCPEASPTESEFIAMLDEQESMDAKLEFITDAGRDLGDAAGCELVKRYFRLASTLHRSGRYGQEEDFWQNHVLPLTQGLGLTDKTAVALGWMALVTGLSGDMARALEAQRAALQLLTRLDDRRSWAEQVLAYAEIQFLSGQHLEALESSEKVSIRFEDVGDHRRQAAALTLAARSMVALSFREPSRALLNQARTRLYRAIPLRWQEPNADLRDRGLISTLDALGRVLIESDERAEAERIFRQVLMIIERREVRAEEDPLALERLRRHRQAVITNLAEVMLLSGNAEGALEQVEEASQLLAPAAGAGLLEMNEFINVLHLEARAHQELQHEEAALGAARRMVAGLESMRAGGEVLVASFFDLRRQYFDLAIDLLAEAGSYSTAAIEEAFDLAELLRARGLLDRLVVNSRPWQWPDQEPELAAREKELRKQLAELSVGPGNGGIEISQRLFELQAIEQQIRQAAGVESAGTLQRSQVDDLLEPGTLGLVFWLGHERNWLWLLEPGRPDQMVELPEYCDRFGYWAGDLGGAIAEGKAASVAHLTGKTADCLLSPNSLVKEAIGRAERLLVVADNALSSVPLAMLPHPIHQDRKLIEVLPVSFVPSLSILAALRKRSAMPKPEPRRQLVLIAAPDYSGSKWEALPGARREAAEIHQLMTPDLELLGSEANVPRLRDEGLADARFVHFATHAQLHPTHPELSSLVLSTVDSAGEVIESRLTLTDLVSLRMNADLVVLSACETSLGVPSLGVGPMAFPAAFLHAGAAGVVASLWPVHDGSTAKLMTEMYAGLADGLDPSAALQHAQQVMIDRGYAPYHWAGWVFLGDRKSTL